MFNVKKLFLGRTKLFVISVILVFFLGFNSCNFTVPSIEKKSSIEIVFDSTSFKGKLYLEKLAPKSTILVDSIICKGTKDLVFNINSKQFPEIYVLRFGLDQAITLVLDSISKIEVEINTYPYNSNYIVVGSKSSDLIEQNNTIINKHLDFFEKKYNEFRNRKRDENLNYYRKQTDSILRENQIDLYNKLKQSIEHNPKSLASLLAIYSKFGTENIFNIDYDFYTYKLLSDSLISTFPNNTHAIYFNNIVKKKVVDNELKKKREEMLDKGYKYPDIKLVDLNNKLFDIKTIKADIIAVYLWKSKYKAFWDNNVKLRELYKKYDRKKLEIIGISFEKDKLSWSNYCRMEKMNWINLISGPENLDIINPNDIYPRIFVLDKNFNILAKDATIEELELILKK